MPVVAKGEKNDSEFLRILKRALLRQAMLCVASIWAHAMCS